MPMTDDEVFKKVKEALVEALSVEEDEVTLEAKISADLGAESIDYLDIIFRLEKAFNIKIQRGELFPDNLQNNPEYVQNSKLTPAGLALLKQRMPQGDFTEFEKDPDVNKVTSLFTSQYSVQMLTNYVKTKTA